MSGEGWVCRNVKQFENFTAHILKNWDFDKPLTIKWEEGESKSASQMALIHCWFRDIANHMNKMPGEPCTEHDIKATIKKHFGVRIGLLDVVTGKRGMSIKGLKHYTKGELYDLMIKTDHYAAELGCVLHVRGEHAELRAAA